MPILTSQHDDLPVQFVAPRHAVPAIVLCAGEALEIPPAVLVVMECLAAKVAELREQVGQLDGDACRVCGCTEHTPCEDGCWWVEEELCSSCHGGAGAVLRPHPTTSLLSLDLEEVLTELGYQTLRAAS